MCITSSVCLILLTEMWQTRFAFDTRYLLTDDAQRHINKKHFWKTVKDSGLHKYQHGRCNCETTDICTNLRLSYVQDLLQPQCGNATVDINELCGENELCMDNERKLTTALMEATSNGDLDMMYLLIEDGHADSNVEVESGKYFGQTALFMA